MDRPQRACTCTMLDPWQMLDKPDGYLFAIKFSALPGRYRDYELELQAAWEQLVEGLVAGGRHLG